MPPLLDQLKQAFMDDLIRGRIRPGDRLGEESLGMRWNVSRVPIREMFLGLESDGLLERRPNQGTFVRRLGPHEVEELWSLRTAIESLVVRRATLAASPEQINRLRALADDVDNLWGCRDVPVVVRTEIAFHTCLCEAGQMRQAARMIRLQQLLMHCMCAGLDADVVEPPDEHRDLVQAIAAGDPDAAAQLYQFQADRGLAKMIRLGLAAPIVQSIHGPRTASPSADSTRP